jgi:hypothetical protein
VEWGLRLLEVVGGRGEVEEGLKGCAMRVVSSWMRVMQNGCGIAG